MSRQILRGLSGVNPLGFLAAIGLLRVCQRHTAKARLGFLSDGSFRAFIDGFDEDLGSCVAEDASSSRREPAWLLQYEKEEKKGTKVVADLKPPPEIFKTFMGQAVASWLAGKGEAVAYAAAFATSTALDGKQNTKPTAFHFTAANQQFLGTIAGIRDTITADWAQKSLYEGDAAREGSNLRWDPGAERNWALMAANPVEDGTSVDAPLEWLAFRGLPLLPSYPHGSRIFTTAVSGRGDEMAFTWPLWSESASLGTVRSLVQLDWRHQNDRTSRGIFVVCKSSIRRTSQGFGNFGPAEVTP